MIQTVNAEMYTPTSKKNNDGQQEDRIQRLPVARRVEPLLQSSQRQKKIPHPRKNRQSALFCHAGIISIPILSIVTVSLLIILSRLECFHMHHGLPACVHDAQVQYSSNGKYTLEGSMPVLFDKESLKQLKAYGAPVTFAISVLENSMNASSGGPIPISQDEVRKAIKKHQQSMPLPSGARAS
jgi:hypothetical protein